jgi:hypothetical protein
MNYSVELRIIESVIPARPESLCIPISKEGFPTSGNDKRNKNIIGQQSFDEFF